MDDKGKVAEMDSRLQKVEMEFEGIKVSIGDLVSEMKLSRAEQHENNKQLALNNQTMQQYLEATQKAEGKANKAHDRIDSVDKDLSAKLNEVKEDHGNRILAIETKREAEEKASKEAAKKAKEESDRRTQWIKWAIPFTTIGLVVIALTTLAKLPS